jgi:hypothetical protein
MHTVNINFVNCSLEVGQSKIKGPNPNKRIHYEKVCLIGMGNTIDFGSTILLDHFYIFAVECTK